MPHDVPSPISAIHELLYRLGITANYTGFFQTAYVVLPIKTYASGACHHSYSLQFQSVLQYSIAAEAP